MLAAARRCRRGAAWPGGRWGRRDVVGSSGRASGVTGRQGAARRPSPGPSPRPRRARRARCRPHRHGTARTGPTRRPVADTSRAPGGRLPSRSVRAPARRSCRSRTPARPAARTQRRSRAPPPRAPRTGSPAAAPGRCRRTLAAARSVAADLAAVRRDPARTRGQHPGRPRAPASPCPAVRPAGRPPCGAPAPAPAVGRRRCAGRRHRGRAPGAEGRRSRASRSAATRSAG